MLNFAGQDIAKGDYIGQVARTNQGIKRRIGIVMGSNTVEVRGQETIHLRVIWNTYDEESKRWALSDGYVAPDYVFKLDKLTLNRIVVSALASAAVRGHA